MKRYDDLHEGQILYLSDEQEFWEHEKDSHTPDGILPKHTKVVVHIDDSPEVIFKVLQGEFLGRQFMWGWNGDSEAKPEDLLTEEEYRQLNQPSSLWKEQLELVKWCPQRQDSLTDQMCDLHLIANKFGFYDATDFIKKTFIEKHLKG